MLPLDPPRQTPESRVPAEQLVDEIKAWVAIVVHEPSERATYAVVKEQPDARQRKLARLCKYRAFEEIVRELNTGLCFFKPAADFKGTNESEIGILLFDDKVNTTANVLERFPVVHEWFVERIAELRGVTCGSAYG